MSTACADNYLTHRRGLASWLVTLDHKRIGVMYLVSVLAAFLLGGIFAMLVRTQLLRPEGLLFHAAQAAQTCRSTRPTTRLFTVHGAVMIFLVLIPGIPGALGNFVLPIMIGASDVAFPRLNLTELLPVRGRGPSGVGLDLHRGGRYRLDVLHPLQHPDPDRRDLPGGRRVRAGLQLDLHRA